MRAFCWRRTRSSRWGTPGRERVPLHERCSAPPNSTPEWDPALRGRSWRVPGYGMKEGGFSLPLPSRPLPGPGLLSHTSSNTRGPGRRDSPDTAFPSLLGPVS